MDLSVREAAQLLSRSERTVRAQLVRGELTGRKSGKVWLVRSEDLPVDETRRRELIRRADLAHAAVDEALPRSAREARRTRSVQEVEPFPTARALLERAKDDPDPLPDSYAHHLREGTIELVYALEEFDPALRIASLRQVRRSWSGALAALLLGAPAVPRVHDAIVVLESELLPRLGGLLKWSEGRLHGRRPSRGQRRSAWMSEEGADA